MLYCRLSAYRDKSVVGLILALVCAVFSAIASAQGLVISRTNSLQIPNSKPFNSLTNSRVEFRMFGITSSTGAKVLELPEEGLVVYFRTETELCARDQGGDSTPDYGNTACMALTATTDLTVRIQRASTTGAQGQLRMEGWETASGKYLAGYCGLTLDPFPCPIAKIAFTDWHGAGSIGGPGASFNLAWLKWHSTAVPLNSTLPQVRDAADLANWTFNGVTDDSGPYGLKIQVGQAKFADAPRYPPACVATAPTLYAGVGGILDGRGSYPLDGGTKLEYAWEQIGGPAATIQDPAAVQPSILGLVYGFYTFKLTVTDGNNQKTSCQFDAVALVNAINPNIDPGRVGTAITNYNAGNVAADIREKAMQWESKRFSLFIEGTVNMLDYNQNITWTAYVDHTWLPPDGMYTLKESGARHNYKYEDALNHLKTDYQVARFGWLDMGQFDAFERTSISGPYNTAVNGVFVVKNGVYTDRTVAAYDKTPGDVPLADTLLLGYMEPFAEINFVFSKAGSGTAVEWQYWNGTAYVPLRLDSDETRGLTQDGKILFTPPADWVPRSENKSKVKYWVRAVTNGGDLPVASRIFGDDWIRRGDTTLCRGWDSSDINRVNVGLGNLEFNPNPPAGATAKFRYQARANTGFWTNNGITGNPANIQNGKRAWAVFLTDQAESFSRTRGFNGVMFDDGGAQPNITSPPDALLKQSDWSGTNYLADQIAQLRQETVDLHRLFGDNFRVSANTSTMAFALATDLGYIEAFNTSHWSGGTRFNLFPDPNSDISASFDAFLDVNNPNGTKALMMTMDNFADGMKIGDSWFPWERGNRGPMMALATYYMGANPNTLFQYNSLGFIYLDNDDFFYYSFPAKITADVPVDLSNTVKRIPANASKFPTNTTDVAGHPLCYPIRLGAADGTQETPCAVKVSDTLLTTESPIFRAHKAGDETAFVINGHQSTDMIPPVNQIHRWGAWFPAMGVDIGTPDPNGYRGGARDLQWKKGTSITGLPNMDCSRTLQCADVWRRDYTRAIVLVRAYANGESVPEELEVPSQPIDLGGTYYPLTADGNTGPAITSIQLRTGDGVILMKAPRPGSVRVPGSSGGFPVRR